MPNRIYIQPSPSEQAQFCVFLGTTVLGESGVRALKHRNPPIASPMLCANMPDVLSMIHVSHPVNQRVSNVIMPVYSNWPSGVMSCFNYNCGTDCTSWSRLGLTNVWFATRRSTNWPAMSRHIWTCCDRGFNILVVFSIHLHTWK
jgi:hypothetical protein